MSSFRLVFVNIQRSFRAVGLHTRIIHQFLISCIVLIVNAILDLYLFCCIRNMLGHPILLNTHTFSFDSYWLKADMMICESLLCRHSGSKEILIDLRLLLPLWKLNAKILASGTDTSGIVSSVLRALTELFLVAESLVQVGCLVHFLSIYLSTLCLQFNCYSNCNMIMSNFVYRRYMLRKRLFVA